MWNKILYSLLFCWVKLHAFLPMRVLYIFSDFLYFIIYYVVGYRKKTVRKNITDSFPNTDFKERLRIEKRFYRHFTDYVVETIKMAHISLEELKRRAVIINPELIDSLQEQGHPTILLMMGHYGNWEWLSGTTTYMKDCLLYQIYRPLKNQAIDKLFIYLRTKFGSRGIKKNDTLRDSITIKRNNEKALIIFLADQTPSRSNLHYWTTWLNQDTPMLTGPERIAKKLNIPVIFLDEKQVKRGYYEATLQLITDKPQETADFEITEKYARLMEKSILKDPAYYLWTHKRWKHKNKHHLNNE